MLNIKCKCGSTDYRIEKKSIHQTAYCNDCNAYIKHVQKAVEIEFQCTFPIGKYKNTYIHECNDVEYLEWFVDKVETVSEKIMFNVKSRLTDLNFKPNAQTIST